MKSLVILVPAFNEASVIEATLTQIPGAFAGIDRVRVVVIDDGSQDGTAEAARRVSDPRLVVLRHAINRGLGGALGTGLAFAKKTGADFAITYDADGQHHPEDLGRVLEPLVEGRADAVIGSRLIDPRGMPWYRIVGNWGLNVFSWAFTGLWTTDSQSGLRGFNRTAIAGIEIRTDRMEVSSEFCHEIRRNHLRFIEVPIRAIYTDYSLQKGQSNWNAFNILARLIWRRLMED